MHQIQEARRPAPRARLPRAITSPAAAAKTKGSNSLYWWLTGLTLLMLLFGLVMIFSASSNLGFSQYNSSYYYLKKQVIWALIGIVGMLALQRFDYHRLCRVSPFFLGISFILLGVVFLPHVGSQAYGSTRWIQLGPVIIQPSELAKFAVILFAAYILNLKRARLGSLKEIALPLLLAVVPVCMLVLLEPDLGTAVIIGAVTLAMIWLAGAKRRHFFALTGSALFMGFVFIMSSGYRKARFFAFLDPWAAPQEGGFHIIQSMVALGTGNIKGLGLGMSRQKYFYLPNAHTDFIFAIIGEELGFLGTILVVAIFTALVLTGIKISMRAPDNLGRLLAAGIVTALGLQAFINMGAVTGILPITGVTLPFLSSGGSSLVICLCFVGILLNVSKQATARVPGDMRRTVHDGRDMRRGNGRPYLPSPRPSRRTGIA